MQKFFTLIAKHQALLCAAVLGIVALAAWPFAETGMHDDWSYARTADVLAHTGHVVFNGWGAPTLGIMLLPAALLIKLFGFSYSVVRASTLCVALLSAALLQRTLVRCGITQRNATLGTLTFVLSPVALPVSALFLSDNWSTLAIVFCLYCCLHAVQSDSDRSRSRWVVLAAVGNALLGTSRQIAWLGVLVMVPSTLWLLRTRRKPVLHGLIAFCFGLGVIGLTLFWFSGKPFTLPEHFSLQAWRNMRRLPEFWTRPLLEVPMLLAPVLLPFIPALGSAGRRAQVVAAVSLFAVVCFAGYAWHLHSLRWWLLPFMNEHGDLFGTRGAFQSSPVWGERPASLSDASRAFLTLLCVIAIVSSAAFVAFGKHRPGTDLLGRALRVLLFPFSAAYLLLLLPRAFVGLTIDRYLLPLVLVSLVFVLRQYQARVARDLPALTFLPVAIVALYSMMTLQDAFGLYRTVAAAENELASAGISRERFDGGWEFDGMSQLLTGEYVHQTGIRVPHGPLLFGHRRTGPCQVAIDVWIPDVAPEYTLSYDRNGCGGGTNFAPLSYRRLLSPHQITVYIVRSPDHSGLHGLFPSFR